jgi:uncharacterized protein with PIN domain
MKASSARFLADAMLGSLARWLRLLGYDTIYAGNLSDPLILERLGEDRERILLTRDRGLCRRALKMGYRCILLQGYDLEEDLYTVARRTGIRLSIDPSRSRCPICNAPLREATREEVKGKVPSNILKRHERFWICTGCGKVYWRGGHWRGIEETLKRVKARLKREKA